MVSGFNFKRSGQVTLLSACSVISDFENGNTRTRHRPVLSMELEILGEAGAQRAAWDSWHSSIHANKEAGIDPG
jgi:hypothetical protein